MFGFIHALRRRGGCGRDREFGRHPGRGRHGAFGRRPGHGACGGLECQRERPEAALAAPFFGAPGRERCARCEKNCPLSNPGCPRGAETAARLRADTQR